MPLRDHLPSAPAPRGSPPATSAQHISAIVSFIVVEAAVAAAWYYGALTMVPAIFAGFLFGVTGAIAGRQIPDIASSIGKAIFRAGPE